MTNPPTTAAKTSGRGWAYTGAILGGLVSVAANIAHSFIAPDNAPADWTPEPGAVVSAIVWPLFLFIAIEILARTPWPEGWGWNLLRWLGLPPVALVAAFVSYRHLSGLLDHYNEETLVVWFGPLAVDGLMLMATSALLATGKQHTPQPTDALSVPVLATAAVVDDQADTDHQPADELDTTPAPVPAVIDIPPAPLPAVVGTAPQPQPDEVPTAPVDVPAPEPVAVPRHLIPTARFALVQHEQATGQPITADELASRLSITPGVAGQLLHAITTPALNGTPAGAR